MRFADDVQIDVLDISEVSPELLSEFCCEKPALDEFIHEEAVNSSAKTYLFVDIVTNVVVAYTSIACSAIMYAVEDNESVMLAPERFSLASAIEIKYFAVDKRYKHLKYSDAPESKNTLSSNLFRYIVRHIQDIAYEHVGAEYIVLYSVPEAESFYKRNWFHSFESDMVGNADPFLEGCKPMYMEI